jgi:epoxyqueuosine reductase
MTSGDLTSALKEEAQRLGFELAGAAPAVAPPGIAHFRQWLADGFAGQMHYMSARAAAYEHPRCVLEGAGSVLMLAGVYRTVQPRAAGPGQGQVSRYAWGDDYHDILRRRLRRLVDFHRRLTPAAAVRGVVDTAPLLERQFAQLAGLGWIGKNTMLLNRHLGSWLVLAALLTSEPLRYDPPAETGHCGKCRACLDACPTGALVAPYRLDARKCISYWTIESREQVPAELRAAIGPRVFGCDACQEACPWNRREPVAGEPGFQPRPGMNPLDLAELFQLSEAAFGARFRGSPLLRARRSGLLRNAAIALGNQPDPIARTALEQGLHDPDPMVQEACAWGLERSDEFRRGGNSRR